MTARSLPYRRIEHMKKPHRKPRFATVLFLCGATAIAITAYARTFERLADGSLSFFARFDGPADVILDKITLEPADTVPYHYHFGDAVNVVTQGTVTLTTRCHSARQFSAGDAFVEHAEVVHTLNNAGSEAVVMYAQIIGPAGAGPSAFVDPPNCTIDASLQPRLLGFGPQTVLTSRTQY